MTRRFQIVFILLCALIGTYELASLVAYAVTNDKESLSGPAIEQTDAAPSELNWTHILLALRPDRERYLGIKRVRSLLGKDGNRSAADVAADTAAILKHALGVHPVDAELWLALAAIEDGDAFKAALRMSYLTGPNDQAITSRRLSYALSDTAANDPDIRELSQGDIRLLATRIPGGKDGLLSIYRASSAQGRTALAQTLSAIDPGLASTLTSRQK